MRRTLDRADKVEWRIVFRSITCPTVGRKAVGQYVSIFFIAFPIGIQVNDGDNFAYVTLAYYALFLPSGNGLPVGELDAFLVYNGLILKLLTNLKFLLFSYHKLSSWGNQNQSLFFEPVLCISCRSHFPNLALG